MMNVKAIVFDVGGTLMEYKNMPNVWIDFYQAAFDYVNTALELRLSDSDIKVSVDKLRSYNPKIKYREIDYAPEEIFNDVTSHWNCEFSINDVMESFFSSMQLTGYIYPETISVLEKLRTEDYKIAVLTDVATGMPDELHKSYFKELMPFFNLYVSSVSCGYRKPNPKGLEQIADRFNMAADHIIFVGDEEKDIQTAKRFGCLSVLIDRYDSKADFRQDYTVKDLNELLILLNKKKSESR